MKLQHLLESKQIYYETFFSANKNNLSKIWKGIKEIVNIKSKNFDQPTCLIDNDKNITNPNVIANSFNQYFTSIADDNLKNANMKDTNHSMNIYLIQQTNPFLFTTATIMK